MTTGQRIRQARIQNERRFSQLGLAVATGVHENTVANWESDRYKPSDGNLYWLARALGVTVESLIGGEE